MPEAGRLDVMVGAGSFGLSRQSTRGPSVARELDVETHVFPAALCGAAYTWVFNTCFFGPAGNRQFLVSGRPRRPQTLFQKVGASPLTVWDDFWGRRGRPDRKNRRCPAGSNTMYYKPKVEAIP